MSTLIRGGTVVDAEHSYRADVLIEGEQIVATAVQQQTEAVRHVANSALDSSNSAHRITQTVGSLAEIIATLDRAVSSFERRDDA